MTNAYFIRRPAEFTKTEKKLIDYILGNQERFIYMTISEVARNVGASEPTVSRFARHCGFRDFKELKNTVIQHLEENSSPARKLTSTLDQKNLSSPEGMLRHQQFCIEKTLDFLDEARLEEAVTAITRAETIYIYAKGAALSVAELLRFRLSRFGMHVVILPPGSSELFEYMHLFTPRDLVILFGFQKTSREAAVLLDYQKKLHFQSIFFTSRLYQDEEANAGVISLYVYRGTPSEYHSMAAPMALADMLVVLTANRLGQDSGSSLEQLYQLKETYKNEIPR